MRIGVQESSSAARNSPASMGWECRLPALPLFSASRHFLACVQRQGPRTRNPRRAALFCYRTAETKPEGGEASPLQPWGVSELVAMQKWRKQQNRSRPSWAGEAAATCCARAALQRGGAVWDSQCLNGQH